MNQLESALTNSNLGCWWNFPAIASFTYYLWQLWANQKDKLEYGVFCCTYDAEAYVENGYLFDFYRIVSGIKMAKLRQCGKI